MHGEEDGKDDCLSERQSPSMLYRWEQACVHAKSSSLVLTRETPQNFKPLPPLSFASASSSCTSMPNRKMKVNQGWPRTGHVTQIRIANPVMRLWMQLSVCTVLEWGGGKERGLQYDTRNNKIQITNTMRTVPSEWVRTCALCAQCACAPRVCVRLCSLTCMYNCSLTRVQT